MPLETLVLKVLKRENKGVIYSLLRFLLYLFSLPYQGVVKIRNLLYDQGWLSSYTPPTQLVISIGNIVAGGTGKTPVVKLLAKHFSQIAPTAILSRGYRSQAEKLSTPVLLHKAQGIMHSAFYAGDEPCLLADNVEKVRVYVGRNRIQSSSMAVKAGVQVLLLDDGLQQRQLARDYEVIVVDGDDPFGMGYFLPRGFLRDEIKTLSRADLIIVKLGASSLAPPSLSKLTKAPIVFVRTTFCSCYHLKTNQKYSLEDKRVGLFCGIAKPSSFLSLVESLKGKIVAQAFFPDHANFIFEEIEKFATRAKAMGAEALVCTEKDKVKMHDFPDFSLPIYWVKTTLEIVDGEDDWQAFLSQTASSFNTPDLR